MPLEPLPETREALEEVGRWSEDDLLDDLVSQGELVRRVVPSCVGLSLTYTDAGLTFTLVASSTEVAVLDGVQYAVGGPCVDAVAEDMVFAGGGDDGLLGEDRWADFARSGAASGVGSTLSLPVHDQGRVVGGVNLYAAQPHAFEGLHEELAAVLGAWAPGAISNADLAFATRETARRAPRLIEEQAVIGQATGLVMAARGVDRNAARQLITEAADQSGADEVQIARAILRPHVREDDSRV